MSEEVQPLVTAPPYRSGLWLLAATIFIGQVGLIWFLGTRQGPAARLPNPAPGLAFAPAGLAELIELKDPTLFALPQAKGFSGLAWLQGLPLPRRTFEWREAPWYFSITTNQLGAGLAQLLSPNGTGEVAPGSGSVPTLTMPLDTLQLAAPPSGLRIEEFLPGRRLLTSLALPPWASTELLTNTVIRLAIDREGKPVSATLLERSGKPEADQYALDQSARFRFDPVPRLESVPPQATRELDFGQVIFEWQTVPTNAPSATAAAP